MKFYIHIGESRPNEWEYELKYEERRPGYSRPTNVKSGNIYASFQEAKDAAEKYADGVARRHSKSVNYTYEAATQ